MGYDPRIGIGLAAASVAMKAKCGQLDEMDVDDLYARAEQELGHDDPLFRAVSAFATQYQVWAHDAPQLARLGDALSHAVIVASRPDPVDMARVDIHG